MSLLLREEHRILLCHDRVMLATTRHEFTRHGMKRHTLDERVLPCNAATGEASWHGPLGALEAALPDLAHRSTHMTVVVSNHFARYAVIPWSEALNDDKEETAFVRHSFREMYGCDADSWDLRIHHNKTGMMHLACAMDARLLEDLRGLFVRTGARLHSIQPHLMAAYNSCRAALRGRNAWLVLVEHGNLCLARLQDGQWLWVRTIRSGAGWRDRLPLLLEREEFLANAGIACNEVFLWVADHRDGALPSSVRWQFQYLNPPQLTNPVPEQEGQFAMCMNG